jgi:hypothetical protein
VPGNSRRTVVLRASPKTLTNVVINTAFPCFAGGCARRTTVSARNEYSAYPIRNVQGATQDGVTWRASATSESDAFVGIAIRGYALMTMLGGAISSGARRSPRLNYTNK